MLELQTPQLIKKLPALLVCVVPKLRVPELTAFTIAIVDARNKIRNIVSCIKFCVAPTKTQVKSARVDVDLLELIFMVLFTIRYALYNCK